MKGLSSTKAEIAAAVLSSLGMMRFRSQFGGFSVWHEQNMFGVIADDELYLRANGELRRCFARHGMAPFVYTKRGIPVKLGYYRVEEEIWQDHRLFRALARASIRQSAQEKALCAREAVRLHTLPNITVSMERWLYRIGITSVEQLKQAGAEKTFLLLKKIKQDLPNRVLFDLAGAINGYHQAVLPRHIRHALGEWLRDYLRAQGKGCP